MARFGCRAGLCLMLCLVLASGTSVAGQQMSVLDLLLGNTGGSSSTAPATEAPAADSSPAADAAPAATNASAGNIGNSTPATNGGEVPPASTDPPTTEAPAAPAADQPAASSAPASEQPPADQPAGEQPAASTAPATEQPAASTAPATEQPAASTAPATEQPAEAAAPTAAPTEQQPAASTAPTADQPAASAAPTAAPADAGSNSTTPASSDPMANGGEVAPAPAGSPTDAAPAANSPPSALELLLGGAGGSSSAPSSTTTNSTAAPTPSSGNSTVVAAPIPSGNSSAPAAAATPTVQFQSPPANLPPAPPTSWKYLAKDTALVVELELRGKYIVPWTSPKTYVVKKVLRDRYWLSADVNDISVNMLSSFTYLSYDLASRRRLSFFRELLQQEKSGVQLQVVLATNPARTDSEISSLMGGIINGTLASDLTYAGVPVENATLASPPETMTMDDWESQNQPEESGGMPGWAIGLIVAFVLLLVPWPVYWMVKTHKRKRKEAIAKQQAMEAAARARAQSRIIKPKSFTLSPSAHHIMVRTGGLAPSVSNGSQVQRTLSMQSRGSIGSMRSVRFQGEGYPPSGRHSRQPSMSRQATGMPSPQPSPGQGYPSPQSHPLPHRGLAAEDSQENMMHYTRSGEMGLRAQHSPEREDSRTAPRHPYTSPPPSNTVVEIYPSTEDLQRSRSSFSRQ